MQVPPTQPIGCFLGLATYVTRELRSLPPPLLFTCKAQEVQSAFLGQLPSINCSGADCQSSVRKLCDVWVRECLTRVYCSLLFTPAGPPICKERKPTFNPKRQIGKELGPRGGVGPRRSIQGPDSRSVALHMNSAFCHLWPCIVHISCTLVRLSRTDHTSHWPTFPKLAS